MPRALPRTKRPGLSRSAKSLAAHLTGVCAVIEREHEVSRINDAVQRWLSRNPVLERPAPPTSRGTFTVADLGDDPSGVRAWATSTWEAWTEHHAVANRGSRWRLAGVDDVLAHADFPAERRTPSAMRSLISLRTRLTGNSSSRALSTTRRPAANRTLRSRASASSKFAVDRSIYQPNPASKSTFGGAQLGAEPRSRARGRRDPDIDGLTRWRKLSPVFDAMYAEGGRPSIPPERLLKSMLLIARYSVRSGRQFCEPGCYIAVTAVTVM